jgi:opacity protein-like surface antigen
MKHISALLLFGLIFPFSTAVTLAETTELTKPAWDIAVNAQNGAGSFDYYLHYSKSSQLLSQVSLPQEQLMTVLHIKHILPNGKASIKLVYGQTGTVIKGRGYDADWVNPGSDIMTDYGKMDAYGRQQLFSMDLEKGIFKNERRNINVFAGWEKREIRNELQNAVYYLSYGNSFSDGKPQADDGSTLDGIFSGFHLGINDEWLVGAKLSVNTGLALAFLHAKALGCWRNHDPAWYWEDNGDTIGYTADIGLKYKFSRNIGAELGYYYFHAKSTDCQEQLNNELLSNSIDLKYEQKGLRCGVSFLF